MSAVRGVHKHIMNISEFMAIANHLLCMVFSNLSCHD